MEFTKDIQFNTNPTVNGELSITYNGFLGNSQELYIVYGYGDNWENTSETKMEKTENGFVGTINLLNYEKLNFCFKNSNNEWDNNLYCNYTTEISSAVENSQNFDIDSLIEELLFEPVSTTEFNDSENIVSDKSDYEINNKEENSDLAYQLSTLMESVTNQTDTAAEFEEYSTLDEILTATKSDNVLEENTNMILEELEDEESSSITTVPEDNIGISDNITTNNNKLFENFLQELSYHENEDDNSDVQKAEPEQQLDSTSNEEKSLIEQSDSFVVSSRQLGTFYILKKRIKLAFYKIFIKLPKMILGIEDEEI